MSGGSYSNIVSAVVGTAASSEGLDWQRWCSFDMLFYSFQRNSKPQDVVLQLFIFTLTFRSNTLALWPADPCTVSFCNLFAVVFYDWMGGVTVSCCCTQKHPNFCVCRERWDQWLLRESGHLGIYQRFCECSGLHTIILVYIFVSVGLSLQLAVSVDSTLLFSLTLPSSSVIC